ncbi:MAG: MFS transporter [Cellulomonadaceae bacterium]|nr:MFS transporter [Cellulomonadaceae bacterium]
MTSQTTHAADSLDTDTTEREPLGRRFGAHLTATGLANLADGVMQVGLPLYAVTLTRSPLAISLLSAAVWLPWLLLAIGAGLVVDRSDRKHVQIAGLTVRALALTAGATLIAADRMSIEALVVLALVYGATDVLVDLAQNAIVPDLVPRTRLQAANGRLMAVQQIAASFVGAPVAAFLLALGATWVVGVAAGLAVAAIATLAVGVPGSYRHAAPTTPGPHAALADIREGLRMLIGHPVLRPMTLAGSVANMAMTGYTAVLVLWAVGPGSALGLTGSQYAWMGAAMAVGAVLASLVVEPVVTRLGELRTILGGWWIGAAVLAVPVLLPLPWLLYPVAFVLGASISTANVASQSVRQRLVAPRLLGRVGGASRTLGYGLMPLGALTAGLAAGHWGLAPTLLGASALAVLAPLLPALTVRRSMLGTP